MKYIASVSFGKDSLAMLLIILEKKMPLDEVVFYDTGMEFDAIYGIRDKIKSILKAKCVKYTEVKHLRSFEYDMLEKPICKRGTKIVHKYGYGWCGTCRWGTAQKVERLKTVTRNSIQYVGIACDEEKRLDNYKDSNKLFPLVDLGMTEFDCLNYCRKHGYDWTEDGVGLYGILDRVSCWCCRNKNLKELKNMYLYLPRYWEKLKQLQSKLEQPMKGKGKSVFDLEERFKREMAKGELK